MHARNRASFGLMTSLYQVIVHVLTTEKSICRSAIANHDESDGVVADPIAAALIIADKSDVCRSCVRTKDPMMFDIHDRVNYAVTGTELICDPAQKRITLQLTVDEDICTRYEYFDIFLGRMTMCAHAARFFGGGFFS